MCWNFNLLRRHLVNLPTVAIFFNLQTLCAIDEWSEWGWECGYGFIPFLIISFCNLLTTFAGQWNHSHTITILNVTFTGYSSSPDLLLCLSLEISPDGTECCKLLFKNYCKHHAGVKVSDYMLNVCSMMARTGVSMHTTWKGWEGWSVRDRGETGCIAGHDNNSMLCIFITEYIWCWDQRVHKVCVSLDSK